MKPARRFGFAIFVMGCVLVSTAPAAAVEYRLQVVSMLDNAAGGYLTAGEFKDRASGSGLERLQAAMDRGDSADLAVLLGDRPLQGVDDQTARAFGSVPVQATAGASRTRQFWEELRWDGKPGEQSLWVLAPRTNVMQAVERVALKGTGPMRQFRTYTVPAWSGTYNAVKFPLSFLDFYADRGILWTRYVSPVLDLGEGIGAVVGVNPNEIYADWVYLVVRHAAEPTTYRAVVFWKARKSNRSFFEGASVVPEQ